MTTILGTPLYVDFARTAKRLSRSAVHSDRMAKLAIEYWRRDEFTERAKRQRATARDFLKSAREVKKGHAG